MFFRTKQRPKLPGRWENHVGAALTLKGLKRGIARKGKRVNSQNVGEPDFGMNAIAPELRRGQPAWFPLEA